MQSNGLGKMLLIEGDDMFNGCSRKSVGSAKT